MSKDRKGKSGLVISATGMQLNRDGKYFEKADTGFRCLTLHGDFHTTDHEGFITFTQEVVMKIFGTGAEIHFRTGAYKKGTYVYGFGGVPVSRTFKYKDKITKEDRTGFEYYLDLGSSPANLGVNVTTIGALTSKVVPVSEVVSKPAENSNEGKVKNYEEATADWEIPF
jgi:hypothetical protein